MKKLLFTIGIATMFVACNQNTKSVTEETNTNKTGVLIKKGSTYSIRVVKKRDSGVTDTVTFNVDNILVDSLKIKEVDINQMCLDVVWFADFNVNFKPTYSLPKEAMLFYTQDDKSINGHIRGTAENAYGVRDEMSTMMSFDKKKYEVIPETIVSL